MIVGARIPDELKVKIEDICEREGKSVSSLVRELLEEYVKENEEEWSKEKICVRLPKMIVRQMHMFVDTGYASDVEGIIEESIRLWLRTMKSEYQEGWMEKLSRSLIGQM